MEQLYSVIVEPRPLVIFVKLKCLSFKLLRIVLLNSTRHDNLDKILTAEL